MLERRLRHAAIAAAVLGIIGSAPARAQQVYTYVDEKGNVVYSQTPPPGRDAGKVKVTPPARAAVQRPPGRDYEAEVIRRQRAEDRRREMEAQRDEQRQQMEEARKKRVAELEARCIRDRGTDCRNPETLRRMEAEERPGTFPGRRR
ncbi:MAG: DUF4124 domain-containing protein [Burkholderiales bacterium]|nr:DUF4124 domain-containing protein [Burkholderiales bacterium]